MGTFFNLDIAIGLIFIILVLSLVCMAINEWIAQLMALRSGTLKNGIDQLLGNPLAQQFYDHPLIAPLRHAGRFDKLTGRNGYPSYIPKELFSAAVLDIAGGSAARGSSPTLQEVRETINRLPDGANKGALLYFLNQVDDVTKARPAIEKWFDDAMDRVSGQFTRRIRIITIGVATAVAVLINADAFVITDNLTRDPALREAIVALAQRTVEQGPPFVSPTAAPKAEETPAVTGTPAANVVVTPTATPEAVPLMVDTNRVSQLVARTTELGLPLGWDQRQEFDEQGNAKPLDWDQLPKEPGSWPGKVLGLLIMAAAISLGAPFWFDMLMKVVNIRGAGPRPATATTTTSAATAATGAATSGSTGTTDPTA